MAWFVSLEGDRAVLAELARLQGLAGWAVSEEGPQFYVRIEEAADWQDAKARAQALLDKANRRVGVGAHRSIRPATVGPAVELERDDLAPGARQVFHELVSVPINSEHTSGVRILFDDYGVSEYTLEPRETTLEDLYPRFEDDEVAQKVIDDLIPLDQRPLHLMKVYERVTRELAIGGGADSSLFREELTKRGRKRIVQLGWATDPQIGKFTSSMHAKRHADDRRLENPMSEEEAFVFIRDLVTRWLQHRLDRSSR